MRIRTTRLLAVLALGCGSAGPTGVDLSDGLQVLFVGNSLTYTYNVPGILAALIDSARAGPAVIEAVAYGGFGLEDHWVVGAARTTIARGGWDVVALQQGPSATEGRPSLLEYSRKFAEEIRGVGARPALYMVWPATDRFFDFDGVSDSYATAAAQVDGLLFPVGEAWRAAWRVDPDILLYGPDGFHQTLEGSYLAALVMFEQLTGRSPVGLPNELDVPTSSVGELPGPDDTSGSGRGRATRLRVESSLAGLLQQAAATANKAYARR